MGIEAAPPAPGVEAQQERYLALDAYQGAFMILLISGGFDPGQFANHPLWGGLAASSITGRGAD